MTTARLYTSRRMNIIEALVLKLKDIDGSGSYLMDVNENVHPSLKFWDEIEEFPAIHLRPPTGYTGRGVVLVYWRTCGTLAER